MQAKAWQLLDVQNDPGPSLFDKLIRREQGSGDNFLYPPRATATTPPPHRRLVLLPPQEDTLPVGGAGTEVQKKVKDPPVHPGTSLYDGRIVKRIRGHKS